MHGGTGCREGGVDTEDVVWGESGLSRCRAVIVNEAVEV